MGNKKMRKVTGRRLLTALLVVLMIFSALPSVMADDHAGSSTDGTSEEQTVDATDSADSHTLTGTKTIAPVDGQDDTYRITMSVDGKNGSISVPTDYILVLDTSRSMSGHLTGLKEAVRGTSAASYQDGFIQQILAANSENRITIIQFNTGKGTSSKILSDFSSNSAALVTAANNMSITAGTNYCAGLNLAYTQYSKSTQTYPDRNKVMVFFSDGYPSCAYTAWGGTTQYPDGTFSTTDKKVISYTNSYTAAFKQNCPGLSYYSIGFGIQGDPPAALSNLGSTRYYAAADASDLNEVFKDIATKTFALSQTTITDPLTSSVEFTDVSESGAEVTKNDTLLDSTQYTLSFSTDDAGVQTAKVILNGVTLGEGDTLKFSFNVKVSSQGYADAFDQNTGLTGEGLHDFATNQPTNGATGILNGVTQSLTYTSPTIKIKGAGSLVVTKTDSTNPDKLLSGATFTLYRTGSDYEITSGDTGISSNDNKDGTYSFSKYPTIGYYVLKETVPPSGYEGLTDEIHFTVTYVDHKPVITVVSPESVTADNRTEAVLKLDVPNNPSTRQLLLSKVSENEEALPGTTYQVWNNYACTGDPVAVAVSSSDSDGVLFYQYDKDTKGASSTPFDFTLDTTYFIKETSAPNGYDIDNTVYALKMTTTENTIAIATSDTTTSPVTGTWPSITAGSEPVVTFSDILTTKDLYLLKTDGLGVTAVSGAVFNIYSTDPTISGTTPELLETVTSGSDAIKLTKSYAQNTDYYIMETAAPSGYVMDNTVYKFSYTLTGDSPVYTLQGKASGASEYTDNPTQASFSMKNDKLTLSVKNYVQPSLPLTGGNNQAMWLVIAGIAALGCAGFFVYKDSKVRKGGLK